MITDEKVFPVTERMLKNVEQFADNQDQFGFAKYGKPLDSRMNYDWLGMVMEEMVDALKYIQCEKERKDMVTSILHVAIEKKNWTLVQEALRLVSSSGTGK